MRLQPHEQLWIGADAREAARLAADRFVEALHSSSPARSVSLAGGSTPRLLYEVLASEPYDQAVAWPAVQFFWGDERSVPPHHPDSNYRMAMESLLKPRRIARVHIHRMPADDPDPSRGAGEYEQVIRRLVPPGADGLPSIDLAVLGLGADGHTASLFPGTTALTETSRLVTTHFVAGQNAWRMTMTFPLLMAARELLFFVTGPAKADVVSQILSRPPAAASAEQPSHAGGDLPALRLRQAPARITWVLDAEAARLVAPAEGA